MIDLDAPPGPPHLIYLIGLYEYTKTSAATLFAENADPEGRTWALNAETYVSRKLAEALADHGRAIFLGSWHYIPLAGTPPDFKRISCTPKPRSRAGRACWGRPEQEVGR